MNILFTCKFIYNIQIKSRDNYSKKIFLKIVNSNEIVLLTTCRNFAVSSISAHDKLDISFTDSWRYVLFSK